MNDLKESYHQLNDVFPNLSTAGMILRDVKSASHHCLTGAVYHKGEMYESQSRDVEPVTERIGSGDAFCAGLIFSMLHKKPISYATDYATAAAALKMTISGDFSPFNSKTVENIMSNDHQGKIQR